MKYSVGVTRLVPTVIFVALYVAGALLQAKAMQRTDMGPVYIAVLGLEAVAAILLSVVVLHEHLSLPRLAAVCLFPAERATPILALSRFADLDARVRFEDDVVRVRIPLGRRHADLMRHGFLMTVPAVPWLGDRAVDLGGA